MRRLAPLLLLALVVGLVVAPVAALAAPTPHAAEDGSEGGDDDMGGGGEAPVDAPPPAVEFDPNPPVEPEVPAWTYRFLIPTLIALTVVLVVGTVLAYFNRVVRARYEPVE